MRKLVKKHGWWKIWIIAAAAVILLIIGGVWGARTWYYQNLKPVSSSEEIQYFTVESGDSLSQISKNLQAAKLIRSAKAFETYVRGQNLFNRLQAGTYALSPSMSSQEITEKISGGDVAKNLLTILPGKRLDQIKQTFAKAGYTTGQIEQAFNPGNYSGHPALASKPPGADLEGYLYPDSYQKLSDTPASTIVRQSLDEMQKHLSEDLVAGFRARGLDVFQALILASIVLKETGEPQTAAQVAQVFYKRLAQNMPLQSDPTAFYAADVAGVPRSLSIDSLYNTYLHPGLPPGPISNTNIIALRAVAQPANTDYLYFVAGDDGTVHFSNTREEHEEATRKYCTTACGR